MILHHWKYCAEWCFWYTFLSWAGKFGMVFLIHSDFLLLSHSPVQTVPFFPKKQALWPKSTNLSETFSWKVKWVLLIQLVCASGLALFCCWGGVFLFCFVGVFSVLFLVRYCWLVNSVQFFFHLFCSKFSCSPPVLSCHWNTIWFPGASLLCLPSSTLHSIRIRIKASCLLTPITGQKLNGIDWKRMSPSWPRDSTLQGKVCNKVPVAASSSFPFSSIKNTDAINTSAHVFAMEF